MHLFYVKTKALSLVSNIGYSKDANNPQNNNSKINSKSENAFFITNNPFNNLKDYILKALLK